MHQEESRTPSIAEVILYLEEHIQRDRHTLNGAPVLTDTLEDITKTIEGRMLAYVEVKSFLLRAKKG